jgi:glycosyltransferase involved in cell wall biosynthesis
MRAVLSVVVPVFNEEKCLAKFHGRLLKVLNGLGLAAEVLYVDDGSSDDSSMLLDQMLQNDNRVKVIHLSRNFGHQIAVSAGLDASTGDAVVVIDADLQDPPELIPSLLEVWRSGVDVVHAVRTERKGESAFKRISAHVFYRLIRRLTEFSIQVDTGDFRLIDREVVDVINSMPERYRFIRGMVSWAGYRQDSVTYVRDERFAGETKYPLRKMLRLALDAVTGFSYIPLQLASLFGFIISTLAAIAIPAVILLRWAGVPGIGGQTTVLIAILLFSGIQLLFLGILGEYLGRTYIEMKRRPLYVIKKPRVLNRE